MSKHKKITGIMLVVVMLTLCVAVFTACNEETAPTRVYKDKAILLVTALTSGGLYDSVTGEAVWDPLQEDATFEQAIAGDMFGIIIGALFEPGFIDKVLSILKYKTPEELDNNWLWQVCLDENGNSNNPNLVPANGYGDGKIEYGALAAYRTACNAIREEYGSDWDVDVFNYDWRIDNRENSRLLEEYINERGYQKVILSSHSMGGPVVAGYLARNQANIDKVLAYIPNSPAFYGSVDALYFLDDPVGCVYDKVAGMGIDLEALGIADEALNALAKPLIQNMTSVMQLLPFPEFVDSEWFENGNSSCVMVKGATPEQNRYLKSNELYDFYCSRPWAKRADGSLKPGMATLEDYWQSMKVDTNGDGIRDTFSCDLVDTYYFLGKGITTKKTLVFDSLQTGTYDHANIIYGDGDGTMPVNACLAGKSVQEIRNGKKSRLYFFDGGGHGNVGADWSMTGETHLAVLKEVIDKYNASLQPGA